MSLAEDLNMALSRTNPARGQSETWTRSSGLQVQCSNHLAMLLRDEGPDEKWVCLKCQPSPSHKPWGRGRGESQGVGGWEWGRKRVITGLSALGTTVEPSLMATSLQWPPFFLPVDKNLYIDSCLKPLYDSHLLLSSRWPCIVEKFNCIKCYSLSKYHCFLFYDF